MWFWLREEEREKNELRGFPSACFEIPTSSVNSCPILRDIVPLWSISTLPIDGMMSMHHVFVAWPKMVTKKTNRDRTKGAAKAKSVVVVVAVVVVDWSIDSIDSSTAAAASQLLPLVLI